MELQANRFSACLLMPRFLVQAAWRRRFKTLDPVFVEDRKYIAPELRLLSSGAARASPAPAMPIAHGTLEELITDVAREFHASRRAMRIRLQKLGLIFP
jgi:Zn-dependent peptidase ImmA (M78 family)